jgi:hypothetical protein
MMPKKVSTKLKKVKRPKSWYDPKNREIRKILIARYAEATIEFFKEMPEESRRELAPFCIEWIETLWSNFRKSGPQYFGFHNRASYIDVCTCAEIAVLATANLTEIQRLFTGKRQWHCTNQLVENIIRTRKPVWGGEFFLWVSAMELDYWFAYRSFVTAKISEPIVNNEAAMTMFKAMELRGGDTYRGKKSKIAKLIKSDPDLLKNEVPQLFKVDNFPAGFSYTNIDKSHAWKDALVALVADGTLPQRELVELCLSALKHPHTEPQGKWFVQLLERIPFKNTDLNTFAEQFLSLIKHPNPSPATFGFSIFERLFNENNLSDTEVLEIISSIAGDPSRERVNKAIRMLDKIAKRNKTLRSEVMKLVLKCLRHENPEIQLASLKLLNKYKAFSNSAIMKFVRQITGSLAPSVQKHINEIIIQNKTTKTTRN